MLARILCLVLLGTSLFLPVALLGAEALPPMERTGTLRLHAESGRAFLLFTPDGERVWAGPGWDPQVVCSRSGKDEEGMVFHNGRDKALWIVTRFEPDSRVIEYLIVAEDVLTLLRCAVASDGQKESVATVTYRWISRTTLGKEVAAQHDLHFPHRIAEWERAMNTVLDRQRLPAGK